MNMTAPSNAAAPDLPALARYLSACVAGFRGPIKATKFPGGQSNPTYLLETPSGQYVLRRKPPGQLLKSAHAVDREYKVLSALKKSNVPVAAVYHLCEDPSIIGSDFYLMEYVDGRIFWDPALPELTSGERTVAYHEMNRVLAAIHSVDFVEVGLQDFGKPGNYFARQLERWTKQYRKGLEDPLPYMDALIEWLHYNVPDDDGKVALIHGDYRLDNLMFARDRMEIVAVFDWELATLGHPSADLAYQIMQRRMGRDWYIRGLAGLDIEELGIPSTRAYIAEYCERVGVPAINNWKFCLAFSFFRFASICEGVKTRALQGNASSADAMKVGAMAAPLAKLGWKVAEGSPIGK